MMIELSNQLIALVDEWCASNRLSSGMSFVVGCSTSEVIGERIGTMGSETVAEQIFRACLQLQKRTGIELVFQCCEHLNRALVIEEHLAIKMGYQPVTVVPAPKAGGAMASYAYHNFNHPVIVEYVQADAGMDIGDTMIGMHLKPVAVPLRLKQNTLGQARVNAAFSRPKLIGGERAIYPV